MWSLEYSAEAERDFELIFDHLFAAYSDLGDHPDEALERAAGRIRELRLSIQRLTETPHIGTLRSDIYPDIRYLRRDKARSLVFAGSGSSDDYRCCHLLRRTRPSDT